VELNPGLNDNCTLPLIYYDQFTIIDHIGKGSSFGFLLLAQLKQNVVTLKFLKRSTATDTEALKFDNEMKIYQYLKDHKNPNIVEAIGRSFRRDEIVLVVDYCANNVISYLAEHKKTNPDTPWQLLMTIGKQVAEGLQHLHKVHIVHNHITPQTVLLKDHQAKISSFGCAFIMTDEHSNNNPVALLNAIPACYSAPERFGKGVTFKSDVYCFGVFLWQLPSGGKMPFPDKKMSK